MRRYEPIWIELKTHGYVKITAPRQLHKKIKAMIIKEKYTDYAWKLEMADADITKILIFSSQPSGIFEIWLRTTSI